MTADEKHRYAILVLPNEPIAAQWDDEKDPPLINGVIDLFDYEAARLVRQLEAMEDNEYIGGWSLDQLRPEDINVLTLDTVRSAIVRDKDDDDSAEVWAEAE